MNFILDTNVVSELRKAKQGKANLNVVAWADGVVPVQLYLSVMTILELEYGVLLVGRRDSVQGRLLRAWLSKSILASFKDRILNVDLPVARRCADLHVPDKRSDRDALIAATALVHDMTIATRNVVDFEPTGVRLTNPWTAPR